MAKHSMEALVNSKIYQDYERVFSEATGLPVALRSVEPWQLPHHGKRFENPFCAMLAQKSRACAACLQVQQKLSETAAREHQNQIKSASELIRFAVRWSESEGADA